MCGGRAAARESACESAALAPFILSVFLPTILHYSAHCVLAPRQQGSQQAPLSLAAHLLAHSPNVPRLAGVLVGELRPLHEELVGKADEDLAGQRELEAQNTKRTRRAAHEL